jgi:uncharacterized BrkB/YihY/UPF0761 family membrane protein
MRGGVTAGEMRRLAPEIVDTFRRNGLINFAASISLLIVLALIPFVLFVLALLGFLQLEEVWRDEVAPEIREAGLVGDARFSPGGVGGSAATRVTMTGVDRV